jgi:hypothetical protein
VKVDRALLWIYLGGVFSSTLILDKKEIRMKFKENIIIRCNMMNMQGFWMLWEHGEHD